MLLLRWKWCPKLCWSWKGVMTEFERILSLQGQFTGNLARERWSRGICSQPCPQAPLWSSWMCFLASLTAIKEAVNPSREGSRATLLVNHPVKVSGSPTNGLEKGPSGHLFSLFISPSFSYSSHFSFISPPFSVIFSPLFSNFLSPKHSTTLCHLFCVIS